MAQPFSADPMITVPLSNLTFHSLLSELMLYWSISSFTISMMLLILVSTSFFGNLSSFINLSTLFMKRIGLKYSFIDCLITDSV